MSDIPLSLSIAHLTPYTLVDDTVDEHDPHPLPTLISDFSSAAQGGDENESRPRPFIPDTFSFSPTHNYVPDPFPAMSLGSTLRLGLKLHNINGIVSDADVADGVGEEGKQSGVVRGVRMMCEIQGPSGRYRLGEAVHAEGDKLAAVPAEPPEQAQGRSDSADAEGQAEEQTPKSARPSIDELEYKDMPKLGPGEVVELDVHNEMKELGMQVLIVSVAWEMETGRRTFQRFFKFHVNAPLAIKTRIHTSSAPDTTLDPVQRTDVYLEVLMQNTSPEVMAFIKITLEPVYGLTCVDVTSLPFPSPSASAKTEKHTTSLPKLPLYPNDTRQHLFLLRYTAPEPSRGALSVFPPFFPGGTILPLGRLDVGWVAGKYAEPGRLQTSTLNRRTAVTPIAPAPDVAKPIPTRTASALAPAAAAGPSTPAKSIVRPHTPAPAGKADGEEEWEYDLAVQESSHTGGVTEEEEIVLKVRVAIRSLTVCKEGDENKPAPIILGVQHLEAARVPAVPKQLHAGKATGHVVAPSLAFSPPSRSTTPVPDTPGSARPFSPSAASSTRPSTPLSAKLRQATAAHLTPNRGSVTPALSRTPSGVSDSGLLPAATIDVESITSSHTPPIPAFPPAPAPGVLPPTSRALAEQGQGKAGQVLYLGNSLLQTPPIEFVQAQEQYHTSYAESSEPPLRWEAVAEVQMRWVAVTEGLADLGGVRILDMNRGLVGREWESVGQVWVKPW